jgi:hypothetical protein
MSTITKNHKSRVSPKRTAPKPSKIRAKKSASSSSKSFDITATLAQLRAKHTTSVCKQLVESKDDEKEHEESNFKLALTLLKGIMFKADKPYRCALAFGASLSTNSSGVLNTTIANSSISTVAEWTAIDTLFDQFFIHSFKVRFNPRNIQGGGIGSSATVSTIGPYASSSAVVSNATLVMAALFGASGTYGSAGVMLNNPNMKLGHSAKSWTYTWRNNVRFDPHGISFNTAASDGWQGWTDIGATSTYAGFIQIRVLNDLAIGTTSAVVALGDVAVLYDVSFRARA